MNTSHDEDRVLSPVELASYLGCSIPTLDRWRNRGGGPPFMKIGKRRIGYLWSSLQTWLEANEHTSTKEYTNADQAHN